MDWKQEFLSPPRHMGIYPMAHGGICRYETRIEEDRKKGWGGMVANLWYTPDFPDNTEAWEALAKGCRAYAEQGFKIWLYDEKGYPSGTAGGAVLEKHPEFEALGLVCFTYWKTLGKCDYYRSDTPSGRLYKAFLVRLDKEEEAIDITDCANAQGTLRFPVPEGEYRLTVFVERRLFDSTHAAHSYSEPRRYIDLFDPDATKAFLDCTYEKYAEYVGDLFGDAIPAFFTDEPSLIGWNIPPASYPLLSWSRLFPAAFEAKFGYPVERALLAVCTDTGPDRVKRRCDFWDLTSELISQNYFKVLEDWCQAHNISLSGHLLNEESLLSQLYCYGSLYRSLKQMGQPGIDLLNSDPTDLMSHDTIPIARLAGSVADVFDRPETMSESSELIQNIRKERLPMDWMKATANWHFALGVNNIASYYNTSVFTTEELAELNRYFARTGAAIRKGRRQNRVAVLYPEYSMYALFKPTEQARNGGQCEELLAINRCFANISWELLNRQIDFDYLDEEELQKTTIDQNRFKHAVQSYELLILPCTHVLCGETYALIDRFLAAGGKVMVLERMPELVRETGKTGELCQRLEQYKAQGRLIFGTIEQFDQIAEHLPRSIRLLPDADTTAGVETVGGEILSRTILSHVRKNGAQTIIYLCNMGAEAYHGQMELPACTSAVLANPENGACDEIDIDHTNDTPTVAVEIAGYRGIFIILE